MNHNHLLDTKQVPHAHNNPAPQGAGGGTHNHGTVGAVNAPHSHSIVYRFISPGRTPSLFSSRTRVYTPTTNVNTGTNNMPHSHNSYDAHNAPHTHTCTTTQIPHNHDGGDEQAPHNHGNTGAVNQLHGHSIQTNNTAVHSHTTQANTSTAHSHTGTTASTGPVTTVAITNPYYLLAYIMKI